MKNFCGFIIRFEVSTHFYDFVIHDEYKCSLFSNLHFLFFILILKRKKWIKYSTNIGWRESSSSDPIQLN
jgi:hypothetical protein